MNAMKAAKERLEYIIELRRHFHQYPEVDWDLENTAKKIEEELDRLGIPYQRVCGTGVVGVIEGKPGDPVIGFRSDMDALPIQEETGLPFASQNPGKMHACGHDCHMAMLLGAAAILQEHREELGCTVKLAFQPAEETAYGGYRVSKSKPLADVENYLALHIWSPLPTGKAAILSGPCMASCDDFHLKIKGKGGHGSMPDQTVDPIVTASAVVSGLQTISSREISPMQPVVVSVGSFHAGASYNTIPDEALLSGTSRAFQKEVRQELPERIRRVVAGICQAHRAEYELDFVQPGLLPVINDGETASRVAAAIGELLGENALYPLGPQSGSDDFSYFLERAPGAMAFIGGGGDTVYPHHHAKFDIDEKAMANGAALFVQYAMGYPG